MADHDKPSDQDPRIDGDAVPEHQSGTPVDERGHPLRALRVFQALVGFGISFVHLRRVLGHRALACRERSSTPNTSIGDSGDLITNA